MKVINRISWMFFGWILGDWVCTQITEGSRFLYWYGKLFSGSGFPPHWLTRIWGWA